MENTQNPHFLLVTFSAQGHLNPALQFAKRLVQLGARVTFTTSASAYTRMKNGNTFPEVEGMTFATISDGYADGFTLATDGDTDHARTYFSKFRQSGSETLRELFEKSAAQGDRVTCLVYTLLLPWAAQVAREFNVPSALLWIQPATMLDIYYYYFNGYKNVISECEEDPSWSLKLPNLPFHLKARDLPSFLLPSTPYEHTFVLPAFQEQIEELQKEDNPTILVNTFEALEVDMLSSIDDKLHLIPVGPLLPTDKSSNLFKPSKDREYTEWLNSQEKASSVIYVSFGSISVLTAPQMEELGRALVQTHRPFLWVIREKETEEALISSIEEVKQRGLIVPWCSQVEVLSHPSIGCFVTHCGWNSTSESLTSGVPMVAFPQWTDQTTNAKLVEDVWKTGVRVKVSQEEDGLLVKSEEIERCLEAVMESQEMKENAKRWRNLAIEANEEGGSSYMNLKAFVNQVTSSY